MEKDRANTYLAQVAKMGKLPPKTAFISNLRAFGAEKNENIERDQT